MVKRYWQNADQANVNATISHMQSAGQDGVLLMGKEWGENSHSLPTGISGYLDNFIAAGLEPWLMCWVGRLDVDDPVLEETVVTSAWNAGNGKWAGIILDSEAQWKTKVSENESIAHTAFDRFMAVVRPLTDALMLCSYGVPTFHQNMKYEWWNDEVDAFLPIIYYESPGHTADFLLDRAFESWYDISVGWSPALKPLIPICNAYGLNVDPVERQAYAERAIAERGGVSWWKYPIENAAVVTMMGNL
jgi:hypothetical protein